MRFLRSPSVHHIGAHYMDLARFEEANASHSWACSLPPYGRPSLEMFNKHIEAVTLKSQLQSTRIQGSATSIRRVGSNIAVTKENLELSAKRVILAISSNDKPLQIAMFDADPCWMGPKCLDGFARESSYQKRRALIKGARNKGTVTPEVYDLLVEAVRAGSVKLVLDEVHMIKETPSSRIIGKDGNSICRFDKIVLATGFESGRPGVQWLDQAVKDLNLPVAADGFPIPDRYLQWGSNIFVTGALAELELGPPARNILGARMASERIKKKCSAAIISLRERRAELARLLPAKCCNAALTSNRAN